MKKILLLAAAVATVAASAQVDEYRMKVALADGTSANYKVADISRIDFFTVEPLSLVFDDESNKGYNTTVSNADGVYKLDFTTDALELSGLRASMLCSRPTGCSSLPTVARSL